MNGPQHYLEAERLTEVAKTGTAEQRTACLAAAQVHATLAEAAATALGRTHTGSMPAADYEAWRAAAGYKVAGG
ncbi:hypothetical protein [Streptomyces sp. NPDC088794]|uniref:hypothetical protein n=1 Tax=Streptomyces sp. NPDC088794 TaxID=3365902 RepID=UPI0037F5A02D